MQISKKMLAVCAAGFALGVAVTAIAADSDTEAQAKARAALEKAMAEPALGPRGDTPEIAKAREAVRAKMDEVHAEAGFAPLTKTVDLSGSDSENDAKLRQVLRQKMDQTAGAAAVKPATVPQVGTAAGFPALQGPPLPISAEKQQKLAELLERYRSDEMSPEQYHQARKKILEQQ